MARAGHRDARPGPARGARRSYLILPSLAHPRLLVPRRTSRAAGGAVRSYGEQSSTARRVAVRLAAAALVAGAGDRLLRDRLEVGGTGGDTIEDHLSRELGRPVLVSLHLGPARANRKPVLQLLGAGRRHARLRQGRHHRADLPAGRGRDRDAAHARRRPASPGSTAARVLPAAPGAGWRSWSSRRCRSASRAGRPRAGSPPRPPRWPPSAASPPSRWTARTWPGCGRGWRRCRPATPGTASPARSTRSAGADAELRHRLLARRLDPVEHGGRRGHRAGLGLGAVRQRGAGRLRRAALRPAAAGARPRRRGRRRGGRLGPAGRPGCSRRWACRRTSAAVVAALYLVEILTRYVGDGQTRWGNWRSMTERVLAAARAAAPVAAR